MKHTPSPKRFALAAALCTAFAGLPVAAWADLSVGDRVGKSEAEIRASLESLGYVVEEFEIEDGEIEAEVTLNGFELEVEVDSATGKIAEIELEDD